mgnify:CR=1 FL=1
MPRIPLSIPNLDPIISDYLKECIDTNWIAGGGRFLSTFEAQMAAYVGTDGAVACQSGTGGIHTALQVLGVTRDTLVIAPTLTFIAAINPITYLGATPVFIDCDDTLNMDLNALENFLNEDCTLTLTDFTLAPGANVTLHNDRILTHNVTGKRISALVVVHVFGNLLDMRRVMALASKFGLPVLEDATEAVGSYYTEGPNAGRFAGTLADAGVYSFNANKIITTAGGGMVVSRHKAVLDQVRYLTTQAKDDMLYFIHDHIGYNYRMTNLQAALGVSQLADLEGFIATKMHHYEAYKASLEGIPGLRLLPFNAGTRSNHWFYSLLIDPAQYGISRDQLLHHLEKLDIETRPIWHLNHLQKPYADAPHHTISLAPYYLAHILNLPCSTSLTDKDRDYVIETIRQAPARVGSSAL